MLLHPFWCEDLAEAWRAVKVWDVGGSKKSEQLQRLAEEPGRLVANSRFLGRVEVPLSETLSLKRGQHPLPTPCHLSENSQTHLLV